MTIFNTKRAGDRIDLRDYVWAYEDLMMLHRGQPRWVSTPMETFDRYVKLNEKFQLNLIGETALMVILDNVNELIAKRKAAARRKPGEPDPE